jgi:hypothetical protein
MDNQSLAEWGVYNLCNSNMRLNFPLFRGMILRQVRSDSGLLSFNTSIANNIEQNTSTKLLLSAPWRRLDHYISTQTRERWIVKLTPRTYVSPKEPQYASHSKLGGQTVSFDLLETIINTCPLPGSESRSFQPIDYSIYLLCENLKT